MAGDIQVTVGVIRAMPGVILVTVMAVDIPVIGAVDIMAVAGAAVIMVATTGVAVITMEIMPITNMVNGGLREQMLTGTTGVHQIMLPKLLQAGTKVLYQEQIMVQTAMEETQLLTLEDVKQRKIPEFPLNQILLIQMS